MEKASSEHRAFDLQVLISSFDGADFCAYTRSSTSTHADCHAVFTVDDSVRLHELNDLPSKE